MDACGSRCNACGSNATIQMSILVATGFLMTLLLFQVVGMIFVLDADFALLDNLAALVSLVVFWTLVGPRCCAPCCCGERMPDVPHPCPIGDCSCANPKLMDYPLFIAYSGNSWLNALMTWIVAPIGDDPGRIRMLRVIKMLRVLVFVWLILLMVGICTGCRKHRMMKRGLFVKELQGPAVVVGQPVQAMTPVEAQQGSDMKQNEPA